MHSLKFFTCDTCFTCFIMFCWLNLHVKCNCKLFLFQLFIYQTFYKKSSAGDRGSLAYLMNRVGRIDVQGPEEGIGKYRSHFAFVEDCLDAHFVAAALKYLEI